MGRKFFAGFLMLLPFAFLVACGAANAPTTQHRHFHDLYPFGVLSQEEKDRRAELREIVASTLPPEMQGHGVEVKFRPNRVEVKILYFDELQTRIPENWDNITEAAQKASLDVQSAIQSAGPLSAVLYFFDCRQNLLTSLDGELKYNRFTKTPKIETVELETILDPQLIEDTASSILDELDNSGGSFDDALEGVVYVSNRSNTIHSVSDCSGMKNYRVMSIEEATEMGYSYCPNCW